MLRKELEIRFSLNKDEYEKLHEKLEKQGWSPKSSFQEDIYFCDKQYVDCGNTKDCPYIIRIRKSVSNKISYKSFLPDKTWMELESDISDPEALSQILKNLNQVPYLVIRKHRESAPFGVFEINLDHINDLGYFVEIEFLTEAHIDSEDVFEEVLKDLDLSTKELIKKGYVQLMEESSKK